eukprot:TRINITY_DN1397_c0_g7_i1.p1 TRINITY_DN1397_c0_g7~~TRINITY_DN1397_c0_g7_i1.p1  ORF type:complete len:285 (+),score=55.41 TRINITY_DN1397_c0_g7_i1:161-1015(+)
MDKHLNAGDYDIVKCIGSGRYGVVFKAKNIISGEEAIKKIDVSDVTDPADENNFLGEIRVMTKLSHENIIECFGWYRLHDDETEKDFICIVMEWCSGGDLGKETRKARVSRLDENCILRLSLGMARAVAKLHSEHIIHRDLKPANMCLKDDIVKVGDFGVSKILDSTLGMDRTICGTDPYYSPQLVKEEEYSTKTDIWSLGVVMYELCNGHMPFAGKLQNILNGKPCAFKRQYSQKICNLIVNMLEKEEHERPTATEVVEKLLEIEEGLAFNKQKGKNMLFRRN